jgi:solute carrier family 25 aspartate/glutamate transporter 12/13
MLTINFRNGHGRTVSLAFYCGKLSLKLLLRIIREAARQTKDGRIDITDFLNYASSNSRYSIFTPMEATIIFHFAGRGDGSRRLSILDFGQLLDPRWRPPHELEAVAKPVSKSKSFVGGFLHSAYSFVQGGGHNFV